MPMRWRCPPENSCGYRPAAVRGIPYKVEQSVEALLPLGPTTDVMDDEGLGNGLPHGHARVERSVGVLEHDLHPPAQASHRPRIKARQVMAVEGDAASRGLDQSQQKPARGRLAAAGFADEPQRLATVYGEIESVHRAQSRRPAPEQTAAMEHLGQRPGLDEGRLAGHGAVSCGAVTQHAA
jgi:hypothetical protein